MHIVNVKPCRVRSNPLLLGNNGWALYVYVYLFCSRMRAKAVKVSAEC